MTYAEASGSPPKFDAYPISAEVPLPEGVFSSDAAASAIPEIRAQFDPASPLFGGFYAGALADTRKRLIEEHVASLERLADAGDDDAAIELDGILLHGSSSADIALPDEPDPADYKEAMNAKDDFIKKLTGHAEVAAIPRMDGMATFVVITRDGKCVYGIGPEAAVRGYLRTEHFLINSQTVDGNPNLPLNSAINKRPAMPSPFEWYPNNTYLYPKLLNGGPYIDVVQQPDMMFQRDSGDGVF